MHITMSDPHTQRTSSAGDAELVPLHIYLKNIAENEASFPHSPETIEIQKGIEQICEGIVDFLKQKYAMFENCKLLKTGSYYEGVKIGRPDEFDFMIEMPTLANVLQFYQTVGADAHEDNCQAEMVGFFITDMSYFKAFFNRCNTQPQRVLTWTEDIISRTTEILQDPRFKVSDGVRRRMGDLESMTGVFMQNVCRCLWQDITEYLKEYLPRPWTVIQNFDCPELSLAQTVCWHGEEFEYLPINFDLCLVVPMSKLPLWACDEIWLEQKEIAKLSSDTSGSYKVDLPDSDKNFHTIIRSGNLCRISFSLEEQRIMKQFPLADGRNACMRIGKFLRDGCVRKIWTKDIPETRPNTYLIKTTLYYMYEEYPNPDQWEGESLATRVHELFERLIQSNRKKLLNSYFIPNYNLVHKSDKMNFNSTVETAAGTDLITICGIFMLWLEGDPKGLEELERMRDRRSEEAYTNKMSFLMDLVSKLNAQAKRDLKIPSIDNVKAYIARHLHGDSISAALSPDGIEIQLFLKGKKVDIRPETVHEGRKQLYGVGLFQYL